MQSTIEKEVKTYLTKIKSFLICDNRLKKSIITEIEASIYEYAETKRVKKESAARCGTFFFQLS